MNIDEFLSEEFKEKEGFHTNIEKATTDNTSYREVLFTSTSLQLVVMSLESGEEIGLETHGKGDQFIRVDAGSGEAIIGETKYSLKEGDAIIIPAGKQHNVIAGDDGIKLYSVYAPPHHEDGIIHKTKEDDHED